MEDIKCRECQEWAPESKWEETEVYCEDCGSHSAIRCPNCGEVFDVVYTALEYRGL